MIDVFKRNKILVIKVRGKDFTEKLKVVKSLYGTQFIPSLKEWNAPPTKENVQALVDAGFEIDSDVLKYISGQELSFESIEIPEEEFSYMFPYQKEGLKFLEYFNGRGLLAHPIGSGKTCTSLSYLKLHPEYSPVLIVTPATVKNGWEREYIQWLKRRDVQIITGRSHQKIKCDTVIINYDILSDHADLLSKHGFELLIADESHYVKNNKSQRYKAFRKIARKVPHIIALTGTPILNRPSEFFNILNILDSTLFPNRYKFLNKFCDPKHNGFGMVYKGASNTDELKELLKYVMHRAVVDNGIPKFRQPVVLDLDNQKEYTKFLKDMDLNKNSKDKLKAIDLLEQLKMLAYEGKKKQVFTFIRDIIESEKVIVFATHKKVVAELLDQFPKESLSITGSTPVDKRQGIVDEFCTNSKKKVFVGNIQAAGTGLNGLQKACSKVLFVEFPWNSAELDQAEGRVDREGQENHVNVYYMIGKGSIDEDIIDMIDKKRVIFDDIINGKETKDFDLITSMIKKYS